MTDVSIIIVAYRGEARLVKCLESIEVFEGRNLHYQVIVVDNDVSANHDSGIERRFPSFNFIRNKINGGFANGNNLGAESASGEFLLILNPDTLLTEAGTEKLIKHARANPGYSIISCRQVNQNGKETRVTGDFPSIWTLTGFQRSLLKFLNIGKLPKAEQGQISFPDWVSGSVMLINRKLYREFKGFYEGFWMYYEDVDFCKRIMEQNGRIVFYREVTVVHDHGGSSRSDLRTTAVTKTEVMISKHLYIARNFKGIERSLSHSFLVINNLITGVIMAMAGILLFFRPAVFVRTLIFTRLARYYFIALYRGSWISPRSVLSGQ